MPRQQKQKHKVLPRRDYERLTLWSFGPSQAGSMEGSISVDQDQFICPICLDRNDPVTVPCGHSFCKVCINSHWDQEDQRQVYSCPQCRQIFTPRPVLRRNNMLAEVVEKLKKTELQAAAAPLCYVGATDVKCDSCTGTKHTAIKSCLICLASYCETHIKPHYQSPAFKKHMLVNASSKLQEKICSQHDKLIEMYCRTDQSCICCFCMMCEHKGHDTVSPAEERAKKQSELKKVQNECQQRLKEKQKMVGNVKQAVKTLKRSAQAAVDDSEKTFTELIRCIEKKRLEVRKLIIDQEMAELSRAQGVLEQLEKEIVDLKRKDAELKQLSHTEDHIQFLQSFRSLSVSFVSEHSSSIAVYQQPSFHELRKSLSTLIKNLEEFCREEVNKIPSHDEACQIVLPSQLKSREDFLKYEACQLTSPSQLKSREDFLKCYCHLTLDSNTANYCLSLSNKNRVVTHGNTVQRYADHPERSDGYPQVLCKESLCGRCYWEVEWNGSMGWGGVDVSVSYKGINMKGGGKECVFGRNNHSWSLYCSSTLSFWHDNVETMISERPFPKIGVYVDHSAGTLSFYRVSDTMELLHRAHTKFTQPLSAGFWISSGSAVRLCDPK